MPDTPLDRTLESVWDYPRPPRLERSARRVRVIVEGSLMADSIAAIRVLETSHPPVWYVPPADVHLERLEATPGRTVCEFKGEASYYRVRSAGAASPEVAWTYHAPLPGYEAITDYIAFYPGRVDEARIDDELVQAQAGGFYGGWITSEISGPFKGGPGTKGW